MHYLETDRLVLRDWKPEDLPLLAQINQDPQVTQFIPPSTPDESAQRVAHYRKQIQQDGFGMFACEQKRTGEFMGFIGLSASDYETHFTPCIEIAWRLAPKYWGKGYATEGARAILHKGFTVHRLDEIVSFTVPGNVRSRRVMEKIGLIHDPNGDFQHTRLPKDHPFSWHVLYRLTREQYMQQHKDSTSTPK